MKVWYMLVGPDFENVFERSEVFYANVEEGGSYEDFCEVVASDRSIDLKRSTLKVHADEDVDSFLDPEDPVSDVTTSRSEYLYVMESINKRRQGKSEGQGIEAVDALPSADTRIISGENALLAGMQKKDVSTEYLRNFIQGAPKALLTVDDLKREIVAPIPSIVAIRGFLTGASVDSSVLPLREDTGVETTGNVHTRLCRILLAAYETPLPGSLSTEADTAAFAQNYTGLLWRAIDNLTVLLRLESAFNTMDLNSTVPQYSLWVKDALLFKAEHKRYNSELGHATANLVDKMAGWNKYAMRALNFLPCYAASGTMIQFFAIVPWDLSSTLRAEPVTEPFDLAVESHRLHVLRIAMNMTRIFYALRKRIDNPLLKLYYPLKCGNSTITVLDDHVSKICVPASDQIYELLGRDADAPELLHVEHVFQVCKPSKQTGLVELKIKQFFRQVMPEEEFSLKSAISCVLKALEGLHTKGFAHRNICWPNVAQTIDGLWLLSNFELAGSTGDIMPIDCIDERLLPPESRDEQPYHCAGDVWQVGSLVLTWKGYPSDLARAFAKKLMAKADARPTAQEALKDTWLTQG